MSWVNIQTGEITSQDPHHDQATASSPCALCVLHAQTGTLPSSEGPFTLPQLPATTWQITSLQDPVLRQFEVYALVRAPPLFS